MTASRQHRCAAAVAAASLALTGCSAAMTAPSAPDRPDARAEGGVAWPLTFKSHWFGAHCFDTQSCVVLYRGFPHGASIEGPSPSIASYGRPLEKIVSAGRGPIPNFPPPAKVTWQSKDGTPLEAEIDIGEIFKDELILHRVRQEDAMANATDGWPRIIVVVEDRTIRVYMQATIWTKKEQEPGNRYSHSRNDLIEAFARTY